MENRPDLAVSAPELIDGIYPPFCHEEGCQVDSVGVIDGKPYCRPHLAEELSYEIDVAMHLKRERDVAAREQQFVDFLRDHAEATA